MYTSYFVCQLIYSSIDRHVDSNGFLAIVNNATKNVSVHILVQIRAFSFYGYVPRSRIAGSYSSCIVFENPPYCFPQWLYQFTFLPTVNEDFLFSTWLSVFVIYVLFNDSHYDRYEVISHYTRDLCFKLDDLILGVFC